MCFGSKKSGEVLAARPARTGSFGEDVKGSDRPASKKYSPPLGPPPDKAKSKEYAPPSGPPPGKSRSDQYAPPPGPPVQQSGQYAPPSGAPPQQSNQYTPPSGPPPQKSNPHATSGPPLYQDSNQYAPPPGPPPQDYAPPPGLPPAQDGKAQPGHDWESAVPDTSLFPPPPAFFNGWDRSPASNSSDDACAFGVQWCEAHPLTAPLTLDPRAAAALRTGDVQLMNPLGFAGSLKRTGHGTWDVSTHGGSADTCVIGYPPLYSVRQHSPLATGRKHTAYYEVHLKSLKTSEASVAMGFAALPYPNFRLPGWHRGSMAVHSDDGHRFVNDRWGGASFTQPFVVGKTYGIGMTFENVGGRISVTCFFTRDGKRDGEWDLHEEHDAKVVLPVTGLEGFHDLSCAVGTFQGADCDVVFDPKQWKHHPEGTGG